jgi:hypothetical protein
MPAAIDVVWWVFLVWAHAALLVAAILLLRWVIRHAR